MKKLSQYSKDDVEKDKCDILCVEIYHFVIAVLICLFILSVVMYFTGVPFFNYSTLIKLEMKSSGYEEPFENAPFTVIDKIDRAKFGMNLFFLCCFGVIVLAVSYSCVFLPRKLKIKKDTYILSLLKRKEREQENQE